MSKTTRNLMAKIKRRLDAYVDLECSHCGHEPNVTLAFQEREKLLKFLEQEIENMAIGRGYV